MQVIITINELYKAVFCYKKLCNPSVPSGEKKTEFCNVEMQYKYNPQK
jgi:hypothetical protein